MKINRFSSESTFVEGVTTSIHSRILKKNREGKRFRLALSGGKTPIPVYEKLSELTDIEWSLVEIFLVDERYVPRDDKRSNYRMIKNSLLRKLGKQAKCVAFDTSMTIEESLKNYEKNIDTSKKIFFDLVILGVGTDGHTASLFPGDVLLKEGKRWVGHSKNGDPVSDRLTLTFPALEASEEIFVLVRGEDKIKLMDSLFSKKRNVNLPIKRIIEQGKTQIFLEE